CSALKKESAQCMESQQLMHTRWAKFRSIRLEILWLGARVLRVDCNVRRQVRRHRRERLVLDGLATDTRRVVRRQTALTGRTPFPAIEEHEFHGWQFLASTVRRKIDKMSDINFLRVATAQLPKTASSSYYAAPWGILLTRNPCLFVCSCAWGGE